MSEVVIRAEGLSKLYKLGPRQRYGSLRDTITNLAKRPFRPGRRSPPETIWALRDVSFEVARGDVIGIIGRNGAGKSTLLKILSRITEPTTGRAEVDGRVGSLLEVGTGFHPELTGRENIYLNGAILGMKRTEIESKFDEIVSFSEVERFLDTQMKFYSSGMYVRLAFAVAAHLEPEILIVDEVLAVGDATFQKKCLGKMSQVARGGRTVIFVSHNLPAVSALCSRCLLLDSGRTRAVGPTETTLRTYLSGLTENMQPQVDLRGRPRSLGSAPYLMRHVRLRSASDSASNLTLPFGDLTVEVEFESCEVVSSPVLGIVVKSDMGVPVFTINNRIVPGFEFSPSKGGTLSCTVTRLPLRPGRYTVDLWLGTRDRDLDAVQDAISFDVLPGDPFGSGKLPGHEWGPLLIPATFEFTPHVSR